MSSAEIERVAHVAFQLARGRRGKVTSCEKSNVMESGLLWREVVTDLHKRDYADVTLAGAKVAATITGGETAFSMTSATAVPSSP